MNKKEILKELKNLCGDLFLETADLNEGVIAGGCLRDIVLGKEIKDIDVFFRKKEDRDLFIRSLKLTHSIIVTEGESSKGFDGVVVKMDLLPQFGSKIHIDCIYYNYFETFSDLVSTFDFNINMLYYRKGRIMSIEGRRAEDIIKEITNRELTLGSRFWYFGGANRMLERLKKYLLDGFKISTLDLNTLESHPFMQLPKKLEKKPWLKKILSFLGRKKNGNNEKEV